MADTQLILTKAERIRLIHMLFVAIDYRQTILNNDSEGKLGANAVCIAATLKMDRSILIKLSNIEVDDSWAGSNWDPIANLEKLVAAMRDGSAK